MFSFELPRHGVYSFDFLQGKLLYVHPTTEAHVVTDLGRSRSSGLDRS